MHKFCVWLLGLILINVSMLSAGGEELRFEHITIEDGLSQSAVYALIQDRQGFIWIGTKDGLNRYDGIDFKVFRHNPLDSTTLSGNYITELYQDRDGYIWVGTSDGLDRLNPVNGEFKHYIVPGSENPISNPIITSIGEDSLGRIWVGTEMGLNVLPDKNHPSFESYFTQSGDSLSISNNTIRKIVTDRLGQTWFATFKGINLLLTGKDSKIRGFRRYYPHLPLTGQATDYEILSMFQDKQGIFWLGTINGLTRFNPLNGRFRVFSHKYSHYRRGWGSVFDLVEGKDGDIWCVTPIGLLLFDTTAQVYSKITADAQRSSSLSNSQLNLIIKDKSNVIWIGTNGYGLNVIDTKQKRFKLFRRPENFKSRIERFSVTAILKSGDERIWISADVLYVLDRKTMQLKSFETDSENPADFGNVGAWSLMEDTKANIWLAGYEGVYRFNPRTKKVLHLSLESGLKEKIAYKVFQSRDKSIWIATQSYLSRYDERTGTLRHYRFRTLQSRRYVAVTDIMEDSSDNLWLASDNGLIRFDPLREKFTYYNDKESFRTTIARSMILSITPDPDRPRLLWLGTSGLGLVCFDMATDSLTFFNETVGLPNNVVYAVLPDREGYLWLSTNRGICRFNRNTLKVNNFDVNDGLQSNEFNSGASFAAGDGELFFGGIRGLNYFYPHDIEKNPYKPSTVLTGLRIYNKHVSHKNNPHILDSLISVKRHLQLTYRENIFSLEFAALDYSTPQRNRYVYRMLEFNNQWIEAGNQRSATFTNLPPGQYTFQVRSANNDGVWNEESQSLRISIRPPFYKTWWAYGVLGLLFLLSLWGIRRYELNRIMLKNQLHIREMEGEKLRELSTLKSRFFANISHEFRTPLTLILGPIHNLQQQISGEEPTRLLDIMQRNASRLLQLINQLLELSQLDTGNVGVYLRRGDFVAFIKGILISYEAMVKEKNIHVAIHSTHPRLFMLFDHEKMETVFHNLLANAFKFTPENGRVDVNIFFPKHGSYARRIQVAVADNGPGITGEKSVFVFDRFYQTDESAREKGGSGIGLALVKELVELLHGTITYKTRTGGGAVFTVTLPRQESNVVVSTPDQKSEAVPKSRDSATVSAEENKSLILVIEDSADMRAFIRSGLEATYEVIEAADGLAGRDIALEAIPDLIICDVMMPEMDGFTVCRVLKNDEKSSHIPIVLLTSRADAEDKVSGLKTGADDYLVKPFDSDELRVRVANLIEVRRKLIAGLDKRGVLSSPVLNLPPLDKSFLEKVHEAIEKKMVDEKFGVDALCREMNMSERQFRRKLKSLTGQTPSQIVRSMRLQCARLLLDNNDLSIAEISFMVGFASPAYFTKTFREEFGVLPSEIKQ